MSNGIWWCVGDDETIIEHSDFRVKTVDDEEWKVVVFIGEGEWILEGNYFSWLSLNDFEP